MKFSGVLKDELADFIKLRQSAGKCICNTVCYLSSFARMLTEHGVTEKQVGERVVSDWLNSANVTSPTKNNMYSAVKLFSDYALSLGISIVMPERPKKYSAYTPYIFTPEELVAIFNAADNFQYKHVKTNASVHAPILLRILHGCGLRLNEALELKWGDVDLEQGIIRIYNAKNLKQRLVPMDKSLTGILTAYKQIPGKTVSDTSFILPGRSNGRHSQSGVRKWFVKILAEAGISYARQNVHERGPCLHCFRHQFALDSFLAAEQNGIPFLDFVPFLSTYLGHNGILETDKYLRANYIIYKDAHKKISDYTNHLFPEVITYEY